MASYSWLLVVGMSACIGCGTTTSDRSRRGVGNGDSGASSGGTTSSGGTEGLNLGGLSFGGAVSADSCESASAEHSTVGCDFYISQPSVNPELGGEGSCFAAFVANASNAPVTLQVEYDNQPLDTLAIARIPRGSGASLTYEPLPDGKLPPDQVAMIFLSQIRNDQDPLRIACPSGVQVAAEEVPNPRWTGFGKAFHLTTSAPVIAYDIFPYGGAKSYLSSATLLLPASAWGTNYLAVMPPWTPQDYESITAPTSFLQIAALADDTEIRFTPTADIFGRGGVASATKNNTQTYRIQKAQVLNFSQPGELIGSSITSDKQVGVWGGSQALLFWGDKCCLDAAHQQVLPIQSMGNSYAAVPYRRRKPSIPESWSWIVTGIVDGTALTYDAMPKGAPTTLSQGQSVTINADAPFSVHSDESNPFHMAELMTGCANLGLSSPINPSKSECPGDPEWVSLMPPAQWLPSYLFFTDPTYATTHLVFTRKKDAQGAFEDVTLDCLGTLTGWAPLGAEGVYESVGVDLVADGNRNGSCDNGVHHASSSEAFGLMVWGWDEAVSYAYPAGAGVKAVNSVVVPPK